VTVPTAAAPALDLVGLAAALEACGGLARHFDVDLLDECDSSNSRLMARAEAGAPGGTVIVARRQTAGRGRRGRVWLSAPGDSLTFSLLWRFPPGVPLDGLSLTVGLALAQTLENLGVAGLSLKWPNDLLLNERKLAGILIELSSAAPQAERRLAAVIGVGLNLRPPPGPLDQPVAALSDALSTMPAPNDLLARLLAGLHRQLSEFAGHGFAPLRPEWLRRNAYADRPVCLHADFAAPISGLCRGVAEDGALLLETTAGVRRFLSGEVSLRPA
jgi:BirA family biotin operon repressor/biotin-[acetyl-CoA-carboxylase] ligase